MNLDEWKGKRVFTDMSGPECRGELIVSFKARLGEPKPLISEEGRRFLSEQLRRLTADHLRAIFRAARVDQFAPQNAHGPADRRGIIDAWIAAFQDKVRQIDTHRCQPAS